MFRTHSTAIDENCIQQALRSQNLLLLTQTRAIKVQNNQHNIQVREKSICGSFKTPHAPSTEEILRPAGAENGQRSKISRSQSGVRRSLNAFLYQKEDVGEYLSALGQMVTLNLRSWRVERFVPVVCGANLLNSPRKGRPTQKPQHQDEYN